MSGYEFLLEVTYQESISPEKWERALKEHGSPREAMLSLINDWLVEWDYESPYEDEVSIKDQWGFEGTIDKFDKEYREYP